MIRHLGTSSKQPTKLITSSLRLRHTVVPGDGSHHGIGDGNFLIPSNRLESELNRLLMSSRERVSPSTRYQLMKWRLGLWPYQKLTTESEDPSYVYKSNPFRVLRVDVDDNDGTTLATLGDYSNSIDPPELCCKESVLTTDDDESDAVAFIFCAPCAEEFDFDLVKVSMELILLLVLILLWYKTNFLLFLLYHIIY